MDEPISRRVGLALLGVVALALAARCVGWEYVFVGGGDVVFTFGDPYYHLRRAWVSFEQLPRLLEWDAYLAFPDGSSVPVPPLWTWALAGTARLFGDTRAVFEHVAAWLPAIVGALGVLPVFATARRFAGPATALGAAAIFALLPIHVVYSALGNPDHHAAESLLGAILLWLYAWALDPALGGRRLAALHAGLVAARIAMLLTWSGSLLHLGVGESALFLAAALAGDRRRLALLAAGCLVTAAAVAPFAVRALSFGAPLFSSVELTLLHPLAYAAAGVVASAHLAAESLRPSASARGRAARLVGIALVVAAGLLAWPAVREGAAQAQAMLSKGNVWHARAAEQQALLSFAGGLNARVGLDALGAFVFLVPFAPLAALRLARDPARRAPALFVALWALVAGILALTQLRLCVDYAPAAAVVFALALAQMGGTLARRTRVSPRAGASLAVVAAAALLAPGIVRGFGAGATGSLRALASPPAGDRALATAAGTLVRFAREARAATPDTAGFLGDGAPEYGILVFPGIGHSFVYESRRPTPAGNFGPYVGPGRFEAARTFYAIEDEAEAVAAAAALRTPYVATNLAFSEGPRTLLHRLHVQDGAAAGPLPRWERFRLVTEGPAGGVSLAAELGRISLPTAVPYKLWEIVEGARLRVVTAPHATVTASTVVVTPTGRRFPVRAETAAGADGMAELRVPYATRTQAPARPDGAWRVESEGRVRALPVDDADVREGRTLMLDLRGAAP